MTNTTTDPKTHPNPDLRWDEVAQSFRHMPTGIYYSRPPTRQYKYTVAKSFQVEQHRFKPGTVLGKGTIPPAPHEWPSDLFVFTPAEQFGGIVGGLAVGHVAARLRTGFVTAKAID